MEKQNSQLEHEQPMEQTRGLFCTCFSGVARCQSQHQFLFVCFCALRPMSTAMVIAGRSVYLTTLFPGQA